MSQLATDLNNRGVAKLQSGRHQEAKDIFQTALRSIISILTAPNEKRVAPSDRDYSVIVSRQPSLSEAHGHGGELYGCPLNIEQNQGADPAQAPSRTPSVIAAVILYNVSLTYHFLGLTADIDNPNGNRDRKWYLQKASKLYEKAIAALQFEDRELKRSLVVVFAGVLHNLGMIHQEIGHAEGSAARMDILWNSLLDLLTEDSDDSLRRIVGEITQRHRNGDMPK
mmetsp:Transcript_14862/g.20995  ORF Transcript_14862/g.20995 Transcript_14862/m.20995 type:complete len:225 (-) Transcript_14862:30-704(-)